LHTPLRVLLVEDSEADAELLMLQLERAGFELSYERVDTAAGLQAALTVQSWQIVLADYQLPGFSAPAALELVQRHGADIPVVIVSGAVGEDTAVSSLRAGAADFVMKSNLARLAPAITRELREVEVRRARAEAEAALRQSEEHHRFVARRATELCADAQRARAEAELANRAKSEFIAVMSHELRTPLTSILGYTELLHDQIVGPLNDHQKEELERIRDNGQHLLKLIENLLDFGVISAGRTHVRLEEASVAELIDAAEALIAPLAEKKGVSYRLEPRNAAARVRVDDTRVRQILANLLSNAVKFSPPTGAITISTVVDAATVRIRVADTGCGIVPELAAAIFEPFIQADTSATRRHGGVGLGLTISRGLAREMGGDVVLEQTSNAGSVFALVLPVVAASVEDAPAPGATSPRRLDGLDLPAGFDPPTTRIPLPASASTEAVR
jgi:signal transduction histidine kinase